MSQDTHYDVLGAPRTSTPAELKLAYRRALRISHPDVGGSAETFRLVQAAWDVLRDSSRRAEYDRLYVPQASAPPKAETRRERTSSRRRSGESSPEAATTPTFATVYGHPGGHSRSQYLQTFREWMLSPESQRRPTRPPRIRHKQDRFLQMWGVVCLQVFTVLVGVVGVIALIATIAGWLPVAVPGAMPAVLMSVGINLFETAFLCGGVIATIRLFTSRARAEVRQVRASNRQLYATARTQFAADIANRPNEPDAFLHSPFAAESVRVAPAHARVYLERAIAQETIAAALKALSAEFTVWHDIRLGDGEIYTSHLVVGPQGLFLVEPLLERPRIDADHIGRVASAIGVAGVSGVLFVDADPGAVNAPPAKLGEWPAHAWRIGTARLAPLLGGGIHGLDPGEPWEMRQLVERVARRVTFA